MLRADSHNHQADYVPEVPQVAVCVPTFKRPQFLEQLLRSLTQAERDNLSMNVIVVDNDVNRSAERVVQQFTASLPSVIYEVEPERGIAAARNRLVSIATRIDSDYIAFVDDDEWVEPSWLSYLIETVQEYRADGVAGTVLPHFDPGVPSWIADGRFFHRHRHRTGERVHGYSTANLLLKRERLDGLEGPFDRAFDLTGGSDYHLLERLSRLGAVVVWCDEAVVHEQIPASRGNVRWILKRSFRGGITYSQSARMLDAGPRQATRAARSLRGLAWGVILLPPSIIRGRVATLHVLKHCASCVGSLLGIIGFTYQEYKETHGR